MSDPDLPEPDVPPDSEKEELPLDDERRPQADEGGPDIGDLGLTPPD